jgi:hypothetical protein
MLFKLHIGTSELARQEAKQFVLGQTQSRKGPGRTLTFGEQTVDRPGCELVDQPLFNHSVYKRIHEVCRLSVQQAHIDQLAFLTHCDYLPQLLLRYREFPFGLFSGPTQSSECILDLFGRR